MNEEENESKELYLLKSENVYLKKELEKEQQRNADFRAAVKVIMKGVM